MALRFSKSLFFQISPFSSAALFTKHLNFANKHGILIDVDVLYEDTHPQGSPVGTVVALHGVPGSHKDFKYIRPTLEQRNIRLISINYPGFGITNEPKGIHFDNVERNNLFNELLNKLELKDKIIFMGHSRGSENALMLSIDRKAKGLLLVNPTGLRAHKGIRPRWAFILLERLYDMKPIQPLVGVLIRTLYKIAGLKTSNPAVAANSVKSLNTMALGEQAKYIPKWKTSQIKTLFLYSGKDWIIEPEILAEFSEQLGLPKITYDDTQTDEKICEKFSSSEEGLSVYFPEEGHYLQKTKASLICNSVEKIFQKC